MRIVFTLAALAFGPVSVVAQQTSVPPIDDPSVYAMFFNFHHNLSLAVDAKKAKNAASGAQLESAVARLLRVRQDELAKVRVVSDKFVSDLAKWQSDLKTYVDQVRGQKKSPDPASLSQFDQRKQQLLSNALAQLGSMLSANSWTGLHAYINNDYRLNISQVSFPAVPIKPPGTSKP